MKLRLIKEQGPCPPGGFRYVDPLDGFVCHSWTYNDWCAVQAQHLQANQREVPPELGLSMQDQLCQTLPPGWCNYDSDARPRATTSLGWGDVVRGVETFARWIATGMAYVSQEEADRRALICSRCYLNVNVEGCGSCHRTVAEVTKSRHSKYDFALRACGACKCLLKAKVHFPMETLDKEGSAVQELYPEHCWAKKTGPNYRG